MIRRRPRASLPMAASVATVLVVSAASAVVQAQQPTFTSPTEVVRVDVEVTRNGRPVEGLTAADFEVFDNGARQTVEIVAPGSVPLAVVLALDTSGSLRPAQRAALQAACARVAAQMKDGDRVALLTFHHRVTLRMPFGGAFTRLAASLERLDEGGDTSLIDAAHAAALLTMQERGRPVVIIFSDGVDTASFLTADAAMDTARRSGASVYLVTTVGGGAVTPDDLPERTGGELIREPDVDRLAARFGTILDGFRRRYLLSFTPAGPRATGWHALTVKVRGWGRVRARPGYWAPE